MDCARAGLRGGFAGAFSGDEAYSGKTEDLSVYFWNIRGFRV